MDEPKARASLGQTRRRKDKEAQHHSQFSGFSRSDCTWSSKLILGNGLHEESCHAHTGGCKENADGSWKTRLLKRSQVCWSKQKNFSQEKSLVPILMERKDQGRSKPVKI